MGKGARLTALSIAAIVCIAASNGGTTSQDLKTGFLVGATPRYQQLGLLVGALSSALVIGFTLILLNDASTTYAKRDFPGITAPVADLKVSEGLKGSDSSIDPAVYKVWHVGEGRSRTFRRASTSSTTPARSSTSWTPASTAWRPRAWTARRSSSTTRPRRA